ncbi:hypothetical protein BH09VER1_BH09VER1_28330 [soil metagenome]
MHDEQSIELAVIMNRPPHEMDVMGYLDSITFYKAWAKSQRHKLEFDASLHGRELR